MATVITDVMTENGDTLGEWETEFPIRSGDVITDGGTDWKALFYHHSHCGVSRLVVRRHV
jgi:hypothetical protein